MKITIDNNFTAGYQKEQVKADIKEFKERYTESDLLCVYNTQFDEWIHGEVIKCNLQAFPGGVDYNNETVFSCEMILDGYVTMFKIRFFCDMELVMNTFPGAHKTEVFKIA